METLFTRQYEARRYEQGAKVYAGCPPHGLRGDCEDAYTCSAVHRDWHEHRRIYAQVLEKLRCQDRKTVFGKYYQYRY